MTQSEAKLLFTVRYGFQNNAISLNIIDFILMWLMDQKTLLFYQVFDIPDKPARTLFDGLFLRQLKKCKLESLPQFGDQL